MKKILYYSFFPNDASAFYRSTAVFPYLFHPDLQITKLITNGDIGFSDLAGYDTLFLQRPDNQNHLNLIKLAKDKGLRVIIDYDDDPLHLDMYNPMQGHYEASKANVIECIALADEVWVSTPGCKSAFRLYNKNIHVIPNAHNDYIFPVKDKKSFNTDGKLAVWRGGHSHAGDVYEVGVAEKLVDVINSNKGWTFKFIGQRFEWLEKRCGDNYISQSGASTIQFYKMLHNENPNIVFYPLSDTVFNRSKSNICWMEGTYAGAAFIGSQELSEFGNKVLDFNKFEFYLKNKHKTLASENKKSWEYIKENLLLSKINLKRINRLLA